MDSISPVSSIWQAYASNGTNRFQKAEQKVQDDLKSGKIDQATANKENTRLQKMQENIKNGVHKGGHHGHHKTETTQDTNAQDTTIQDSAQTTAQDSVQDPNQVIDLLNSLQ